MKYSAFQKGFMSAESILLRLNHMFPFSKLRTRIFRILGIEYAQFFLIKGLVKNTNYSVTTLFIGSENSAYLFARLAYSRVEKVSSLGKLLFRRVDPSHLTDEEIIVVRVNRSSVDKFLKQGYLLLPCVSFCLSLDRSMADIIRKSSRRRRRCIRKLEGLNYSCKILRNDEEAFDFFYWKMYLPYTKKRFGRAAHLQDYSSSKTLYRRNGGIVFVLKEKRPIAGMLFQIKGKTLYALTLGVCDGDQDFVRDLACQAALFSLIKWAKEKGLKCLNYGGTAPFFTDGLFLYKKEWGMHVEEQTEQPFCALKLCSISDSSLSFLQQNPFIFLDKGSMRGVVFVDHRPTKAELQKIFSKYLLPKLDSLIVIGYYGPNTGATDKTEISTRSRSVPDALGKALSSICLSLRERGFNLEVFARSSSHQSFGLISTLSESATKAEYT